MSEFMSLYTCHGKWAVIESDNGGFVVPAEYVGSLDDAADYTESGKVQGVEYETGWCARYSANGYADCTSWVGPYKTEKEAAEECRELFGDDNDLDDEEEE